MGDLIRAAALAAVGLAGACAATGARDAEPHGSGASSSQAKAAKHARAVELARQRLAQAQLDRRADSAKHDARVEQARREHAIAAQALAQFESRVVPLRVRRAELALQAKEDSLAEVLEEFEQLKLMYAEQDLADRTREMVIHRTERRIQQQRAELEMARSELGHLRDGELRLERERLAVEAGGKQAAVAAAELDARVAAGEKSVAVAAAEHALADAEASPPGRAGAGDEE